MTSERTRVIAAVVLWASAFVEIRHLGPTFGGGELSLGRMLVGSLALTVLARARGVRLPPRRLWLPVALWGVAWFAVYNVALNTAEQTLDAGTAAMLVNIAPLLVALIAGTFLGEGFPRPLMVGIAVALVGVVCIAVATSTGRTSLVGVVLGLVAALIYGGATLVQKRLLASADVLSITWLGALTGTAALLPFAPGLLRQVADAPLAATLGVAYLGLFPTAVAFIAWGYVLARMSAGATASTTYVVPALALLLGWLLLGELPPPLAIAGGVLCLAGVGVTRLR